MNDPFDPASVDKRLKSRLKARKEQRNADLGRKVKLIDASRFPIAINELARTMIYKLDREGHRVSGLPDRGAEICLILRQVAHTNNLIQFINADETRYENYGYRSAYSFVSLPLIRTMIDGLYNCTAMLNDPECARKYKISGFYRLRETLVANEAAYASRCEWEPALAHQRRSFEEGLKVNGISLIELDEKKNEWPTLGVYLTRGADTPHKQMLRMLTYGFWREYSSISHTSFDGVLSIVPFIVGHDLPSSHRDRLDEATERTLSLHVFRAAGLLLCLLTEVQFHCRFDGANINQRLKDTWREMLEIYEIKELFEARYQALLKGLI